MSKISDKLSYPEASPIQGADYLIGTDADSSPIEKQTKTFTISDLKDFIIDGLFDGVSYRIPVFTAASAGADSEKIVSSLISQDTAQQSGSFILGTTVTIDNGSGAGSLIVADAFTPFGVSTFEGDAFFKTNATINPDANLYLLGKIYDANSSIGNNEQVLVSDSLGNVTWQNFQGSGLEFQGAWDARTIAEGGVTDGGNPNLQNIQLIAGNTGKYWVVSTAGTASLQGQTSPITQWSPGDWAIISEDDAGNIFWDKIDNSSVDGGGTTNNMAMWTASKVLGNAAPVSMIQDPGNNNLTIGTGGGEKVVVESILQLQGAVEDSGATLGTENQVLVSDNSGQLQYENISTFDVESAEKLKQTVRFTEAVNAGDPVYITGYGNLTEVQKAFASDPNKMGAVGLATANQSINSTGEIIIAGDFPDFNTSSYSVGDSLYVAAIGGLTNVKPITPNLIQKIAVVSRSNANNGDIEVFALGRENDVPNLAEGKIFVGSAANTIESGTVFINESLKSVVLNNPTLNTASSTQSTAMGNNTTASGAASTAMGTATTASGFASTAMGDSTTASGQYSIAMGSQSTASGDGSTALCEETAASGDFSIAAGYQTDASGSASTAMGDSTTASGEFSIAMGASTTASGVASTAIGSSARAEATNSLAGGFNSTVRSNADSSIAFGYKAIAGLGISDFNENAAFGFETLAGGSFGAFAMGWRAFNVGSEGLASGHGSFVSGHGSGALGEGSSVTDIAAGVIVTSVGIPSTSFQLSNVVGGANIQPGDTIYNNGSGNQTWSLAQDNRINTVVSATFNGGTPAGDVYTIVVNAPGFILDAGETVSIVRTVNATEGSFAIGAHSMTLGNRSTSIGYFAKAESDQSVAIGEQAWTKNTGSVSIGKYAIDNAADQVAIGGDNIRLNAYGSGNVTGTATFALGVTSFGEVIEIPSGGGGSVTGEGNQYNIPVWNGTTELSGITSNAVPNKLLSGITTNYITAVTGSNVPTEHVIKNYDNQANSTSTLTYTQSGVLRFTGGQGGRIDVGLNAANIASADLNVGTGVATFKGGVVISPSPGSVQVDNSSLVIGSGTNDNISGSDHCLIVGSGNQITSNSDQSVAFGQGNAITGSVDAFAVGNSNSLTSSLRTQALGFNNAVQASSSFIAGGANSITATSNIFALGDNHTVTGTTQDAYLLGTSNTITGGTGSFAIGSNLDGDTGNHMIVGYRNDKTSYPATDYSLGLGNTKFALAVGSTSTTNSNALLITEGGVNRGGGVAQVPRVLLPTVTTFSASNDAGADALGVPQGALYQNEGVVQINRGGGSTTNPLFNNQFTFGLYVGGTTSANLLDDYEEGTFTPTLTVTGTSTSLNDTLGRYTKIGNLVHVEIYIRDFVPEDLTTQIQNCTNLPFTILNTTFTSFATGTLFNSQGFNTGRGLVYGLDNTTTITFYDNGLYTDLPGDETTEVTINITYTTS
jgi:hypothetical protein